MLSSGSSGVVGFRMFQLLEERWGTLKEKRFRVARGRRISLYVYSAAIGMAKYV